jgi:hypothetical protein
MEIIGHSVNTINYENVTKDQNVYGKERALVQINRLIQLSYLEDQKLF